MLCEMPFQVFQKLFHVNRRKGESHTYFEKIVPLMVVFMKQYETTLFL